MSDLPIIPKDPWVPCTPKVTSTPESRTPELYFDVIAQFRVTKEARYAPTKDATFCNIFAQDVMAAMGVPLPREMTANATLKLMSDPGPGIPGWHVGDKSAAIAKARDGHPAMMGYFNPQGAHGHLAILCPASTLTTPITAQAGAQNFINESATMSFSARKLISVIWCWAD